MNTMKAMLNDVTTEPANVTRLVKAIAVLNVVLLLTGIILDLVTPAGAIYEDLSVIFWILPSVVYSVLAVLIFTQHPGHRVGRLFLIVGFSLALAYFGNGISSFEPYLRTGLLQDLGAWIGHQIWIAAFIIPISLILLYFPDGRLPSRRWWPIAVAATLGMGGSAASIAFRPWPWEAQGILDTHNPFGIVGSERFFDGLGNISTILLGIGVIGSMVAVVVRSRKSQGVERTQMKWLVYTAVVTLSSIFLSLLFFGDFDNPVSDFIIVAFPTLLAIAIGIAILRYRLFDIDILIRRTLQYALLSGILALIYFGGVIILQSGMSALTGQDESPFVVVLTTLSIAALFNPLRLRIQDFIDQRFFRSKYNAEQALAKFALTARDEVDVSVLEEALLDTVGETLQPEQLSLWIR
jgi:hypothetical protein